VRAFARYLLYSVLLICAGALIGLVLLPNAAFLSIPFVVVSGYFLVRAWWEFAKWMWRVLVGDKPIHRRRKTER
jgi:hypothetical protein